MTALLGYGEMTERGEVKERGEMSSLFKARKGRSLAPPSPWVRCQYML